MNSRYKKPVLSVVLYCCPYFLLAQSVSNIPVSQTQPPAPTETVATAPGQYPANTPVSYVRSWEAMGPLQDASSFTSQPYTAVKQATAYVDGLGRPLQTVIKQITPQAKDMVSPVVYDDLGREQYSYMPYVSPGADGNFKTDPFGEQHSFLQTQYPGEEVFYAKKDFEASPLNRVLKSYAQGNSWAGSGRGVEQQYLINTVDDAVRIWTIGNDAAIDNNIPLSGATDIYAAGELYKNVSIDERGNAVVEYKDKQGKVILKKVQIGAVATDYSGHDGWLNTYYVYDDLDQLRFVIPPKAVGELKKPTVNWVLATNVINELCFHYEYDYRHRMIAKKIPGAGWVYMIYDSRDRPVFTQDANMRNQNQWMATLYDDLNRPVLTGMIAYTGTPTDLQTYVTNNSGTSAVNISGDSPLSGTSVNLNINTPQSNTVHLTATNGIVFYPGFETDNTTSLLAEIVTGTGGTPVNETIGVNNNPIPPGSTIIPLTISYYDNYNFTTATYNTASNSQLDAGTNAYPETLPTTATTQTKGMVTGNRVRTLPDPNNLTAGQWLTSTNFYDDKGRLIQAQSVNFKGGTDIVTNRFDFTGKVITNYLTHTNPYNADPALQTITVKTNMNYDFGGRLLEIWKTINNDDANKKKIVQNEYDELGQLKDKKLGNKPSSSDPLETLDYNYNVRGWLQGINKDYADGGNSDHKFGMELNYDWGYEKNQYNGNISGTKWRSAGDGEQRSYGFDYDKANRLLFADFNQLAGSSWDKSANIDFTTIMGNGIDATSAYDENGNILKMKQWGVKINTSTQIDNLTYNYDNVVSNSNKLASVTDGIIGTDNGKLGDFKDGSNGSANDYAYDQNGNLTKDENKNISSITYNYLNLPQKIDFNVDGYTRSINYTYDAAGNKLTKETNEVKLTNESLTTKTTTDYINGFVYESKLITSIPSGGTAAVKDPSSYENVQQFIPQEEGRIRYKQAVLDVNGGIITPANFVYDYFIKDHLGNVRMVLTDEVKIDKYPVASLEPSKIATEKNYYDIHDGTGGQVADKSEAIGLPDYNNDNGIGNNPSDPVFEASNSTKLYKLNSNNAKIGLGITLKVMAGDKIDVFGKSYYFQNNPTPGPSTPTIQITDLLNNFLGSVTGAAVTQAHGTVSGAQITPQVNEGSIYGMFTEQNNQTGVNINAPRAFINVIFFDEQFHAVKYKVSMVGSNSVLKENHHEDLQNLEAPKNGFVYIYCSNETPVDVFFDNIQVQHTRGAILEETHYYPFGLVMAGISSKAAGLLQNKYLFNSKEIQTKEFSDGSGLEMYDFKYRFYDMQLGRFFNQDRLADKFAYMSPYQFCSNNPICLREIDGLEGVKYTEVDKDGNKKTIVEKNVVVLTERTKAIPAGASQKKIARITRQNNEIEQANKAKIASVKSELNDFFNGSDGKGTTDSKGNAVSFKFNVIPVTDINKKGMNSKEINAAYADISKAYNMEAISTLDNSVSLNAPASVLTTDFAYGSILGHTSDDRTIMQINPSAPYGAMAHEVSHTLGLNDNGYDHGGILGSPPDRIKSNEVDEILNDAYDKK